MCVYGGGGGGVWRKEGAGAMGYEAGSASTKPMCVWGTLKCVCGVR